MTYLIAAIIFLPILISALRKKEWYLYLLFAFYPILPDTFAIEISSQLPLLTVSRILLLMNLVIWVVKDKGLVQLRAPRSFRIFVIILLLICIINMITLGTNEVNSIFVLLFEDLFLILMIRALVDSPVVFQECLKFLVAGLTADAIVGILQTVVGIDVSEIFRVVTERTNVYTNTRMNVSRAWGMTTSGTLVFAGECAFLIILVMYLYEKYNQWKYLAALFIAIVALGCTMSRGTILSVIVVIAIMFISRFRDMFNKYAGFLLFLCIVVIGVVIMFPEIINVIMDMIRSIMNSIGFSYSISENFGSNTSTASISRWQEWSSLWYMIRDGKGLFGYGSNVLQDGTAMYYLTYTSRWITVSTFDVGFVGVGLRYGLVGLISYIIYAIQTLKSSRADDKICTGYNRMMFYMILLYILLNVASAIVLPNSIMLLIGLLYVNTDSKQKQEIPSQ